MHGYLYIILDDFLSSMDLDEYYFDEIFNYYFICMGDLDNT
jgi:hypothetical protein